MILQAVRLTRSYPKFWEKAMRGTRAVNICLMRLTSLAIRSVACGFGTDHISSVRVETVTCTTTCGPKNQHFTHKSPLPPVYCSVALLVSTQFQITIDRLTLSYMLFVFALLFAAPFVSAFTALRRQATIPNAPACVSPCLQQADPKPCEASDTACLCVNAVWFTTVADCVYRSCTLEEADAAVAASDAWCKAAGVEPGVFYPSE
ncbi:glycoside hydrolase family 79 protein [Tulasnella calospora MUT 4182]|uniref:Glycoside hydrolase family 79 protein n=1 Tax=Tulasnella calospora MUT 4182 TaxID=1051891 RepID=A0A0C3Q1N7_9AGAM|nr:glycoside hydrolase family 79 protein [Tulasnella calospora MUT 4182]